MVPKCVYVVCVCGMRVVDVDEIHIKIGMCRRAERET